MRHDQRRLRCATSQLKRGDKLAVTVCGVRRSHQSVWLVELECERPAFSYCGAREKLRRFCIGFAYTPQAAMARAKRIVRLLLSQYPMPEAIHVAA